MEKSNIAEFFENKSVLVTGITGFIGRAVLIKLLRSCPGITHIYVPIRENRGKSAQERLADILLTEVIAVSGNLEASGMDLSVEGRQRLCSEIAVIIHSAASVKFEDPIEKACGINLQGVYNLLEQLALKMDKLEAFVHVSTAYANFNRTEIDEKVYPTRLDPKQVLEVLAKLGSEEAAALAPKWLEGLPNTYIFAKGLAEQALESYRRVIPLCIVRPSIVLTAHSEPTPGWIHGWSGAAAITAFVLHGFQRLVFMPTRDAKMDLIPVDHVVNLIIAAAWNTATAHKMGQEPFRVYNCCSGGNNPITVRQFFKIILDAPWVTPLPKAVHYPSVSYVKTKFIWRLYDLMFHRLPCQLMDLQAKFFRQNPRMMMSSYWKMSMVHRIVGQYLHLDFNFITENTEKLYRQLNPVDRQLFNFDMRSIQWEPYLYNYVAGVRKYLLHGSEKELESDRRRHKRLFLLDWTFRGLVNMFVVAVAVWIFSWFWT